MHMFILLQLFSHMSVFLVWFYIRGVNKSQDNNLFSNPPFEDWAFSFSPLTPQSNQLLNEYLDIDSG